MYRYAIFFKKILSWFLRDENHNALIVHLISGYLYYFARYFPLLLKEKQSVHTGKFFWEALIF